MTSDMKGFIEGVSQEQNLNKGQQIKLEKALKQIFEEGVLPKEALGLSDQTLEALYAHAYRLYQSAKYKDAGYIFQLLQTLNPPDWRNYLGMGACLHRLEQYETASFMYQAAGEINKENPMPFYYCSDCRIKMGHFRKAIQLLNEVIKRSIDKPEYNIVSDRSIMMIQSLEKQMLPLQDETSEEVKKEFTKTG